MNDLMTNSFLNYVELKKQAEIDLDLEKGEIQTAPQKDEQNLAQFFNQVESIKAEMQEITDLLLDLRTLNEESKSTHSAKILRGLRDRMDSNMIAVLRKTKEVKSSLDSLDKSNSANRKTNPEGSAVDRTRVSTANGLRAKLGEIMNGFQALRVKIMADYKDGLKRRYYNATGEYPSEEVVEEMVVTGNLKMEGKGERSLEERERHEAVMDIWRSLNKLHQVFLDMAVMVEAQGAEIGDIERNVAAAASFVSGGTNSLVYAKKMKKESKSWLWWFVGICCLIFLVYMVALIAQ